jgi:DNA-directed RNA polymerase subunit RPC12/RpoP
MVKIISLKCPECGADISIEEGHKQCFCQYCGAKIMIDDGSTTHTYRKVDEARIKEAEVEREIRLKELELELYDKQAKEKNQKLSHKYLNAAIFIVILISILFMIVGKITKNDACFDFSYWFLALLIPLFCLYLANIIKSMTEK